MDLSVFKKFLSTCYVSIGQVFGLEKRLADLEATPPGSSAWGAISGTLGDQTDLDTALGGKVPTTRTINSLDLSANRTLTLASCTEDATHRLVTDTEKSTWNAKQAAITLPDDPTKYYNGQGAFTVPAGGGGGEAVAFSHWLPLPTDQADNAAGVTHRQICHPLLVSGNQIRALLWGHSTTTCTIDHASVGIRTGAQSDTVDTPIELLFSAASGCVVPVGGGIWSDWTDFTTADLDVPVVIYDVAAAGTSRRKIDANPIWGLRYKAAAASYDSATEPVGTASIAGLWVVHSINVRTV